MIAIPTTHGARQHASGCSKTVEQQTVYDLCFKEDWGAYILDELPMPTLLPSHIARKPKRHYRQGRVRNSHD